MGNIQERLKKLSNETPYTYSQVDRALGVLSEIGFSLEASEALIRKVGKTGERHIASYCQGMRGAINIIERVEIAKYHEEIN